MHDLAVGVSPHGADAWGLQSTYAGGITVGAPPDPYNQNGQDWNQPPWRPDRLAATAYAPFRQMVSTILRHAGGIRVDHVIGLFRLWWIPAGAGPTGGTYVRYDHEAMIGILALEAKRAGALVVGEDLGTVEPWVRTYLRERGILGTSILWFEFDWDGDQSPLAPEKWRELCLASVTTHDLPPTAAYLAGDHVRLRDRLGVLTRSLAEELAADEAERQAWLDNLTPARAAERVRRRGGDGAGAAPLPHPDPVPAALRRPHRRRRGPAGAEPAGHHRRVPQLAGAAERPRRRAGDARGRTGQSARCGAGRGRAEPLTTPRALRLDLLRAFRAAGGGRKLVDLGTPVGMKRVAESGVASGGRGRRR